MDTNTHYTGLQEIIQWFDLTLLQYVQLVPALFSYLISLYTASLFQTLSYGHAYTYDSQLLPNPRLSRRWQLSLQVNPAHFSSWLGTLASIFWAWLSPKHLQVTGSSRQKSKIPRTHWRVLKPKQLCSPTSKGTLFSERLIGGRGAVKQVGRQPVT